MEVVGRKEGGGFEASTRKPEVLLEYFTKEEDVERFWKAHVGFVVTPDSSYNIHTHFKMECYFSIKITLLGANTFLLEEMEVGEIKDLMREGNSWWSQWFQSSGSGVKLMLTRKGLLGLSALVSPSMRGTIRSSNSWLKWWTL